MLTAEENRSLTLTGPGSPMGGVFRRYWQPALLSRELPDPDGAPVRLKVLGEDFVAFRDSDGRVGIVEPQCPHRGANLFFGRNEQCGLRCVYHGWKFDVHGRCVDMPTLSADVAERVRAKAHIRALQVREWGDVIWAYLGDGDAPELPQFEFATVPASHRYVSKKLQQCNWAQACEGGLDTAHFSTCMRACATARRSACWKRCPAHARQRRARTSRRAPRAFAGWPTTACRTSR